MLEGLAQETADAVSASCPEDVSAEGWGTEFECTVTNAKGQGEVPVVAEITSKGDENAQFELLSVDGVDLNQ